MEKPYLTTPTTTQIKHTFCSTRSLRSKSKVRGII